MTGGHTAGARRSHPSSGALYPIETYVVVLVINVYLFAAWQKRKVAEPVTVAEGEAATPPPEAGGGPFSRLRRRDKRVSAYGRPVTTSE